VLIKAAFRPTCKSAIDNPIQCRPKLNFQNSIPICEYQTPKKQKVQGSKIFIINVVNFQNTSDVEFQQNEMTLQPNV
jgi:hypothetical protein